jgi:hypothetical protein
LSRRAPWAALLLLLLGSAGPYDIKLLPTARAPGASGAARLIFAPSPFGVAVTPDGHSIYDARITADGLPAPSSLGAYSTYVAWAVTPDLQQWVRLGPITQHGGTVGPMDFNKFLLVVTAEASATSATHNGPMVLHGTSPSGWLQNFLTHPLFRGMAQ